MRTVRQTTLSLLFFCLFLVGCGQNNGPTLPPGTSRSATVIQKPLDKMKKRVSGGEEYAVVLEDQAQGKPSSSGSTYYFHKYKLVSSGEIADKSVRGMSGRQAPSGNADSGSAQSDVKDDSPATSSIESETAKKEDVISLASNEAKSQVTQESSGPQAADGSTPEKLNSKTTDWIRVPSAFYQEHQKNVGMTLLSKTEGEDAERVVGPPGYAFVGNEQYGQWKTRSDGTSFWEFYGPYLLLSQIVDEGGDIIERRKYRNYRDYKRTGRTYYGGGTYGTTGSKTRSAGYGSSYRSRSRSRSGGGSMRGRSRGFGK